MGELLSEEVGADTGQVKTAGVRYSPAGIKRLLMNAPCLQQVSYLRCGVHGLAEIVR